MKFLMLTSISITLMLLSNPTIANPNSKICRQVALTSKIYEGLARPFSRRCIKNNVFSKKCGKLFLQTACAKADINTALYNWIKLEEHNSCGVHARTADRIAKKWGSLGSGNRNYLDDLQFDGFTDDLDYECKPIVKQAK